MVFSSPVFLWLFLPITFALNLLAGRLVPASADEKKHVMASNSILLLASLFFYAWGEPVYVLLMLGCIIISWVAGQAVWRCRETNRPAARAALAAGVLADLAALFWFKYAGFAAATVNSVLHLSLAVPQITLPIGISFFTFQAISYMVDIYRGDADARPTLMETALYISFFPQLIAGPIVKYREISAQLRRRRVTMEGFAWGFRRFILGLAKKVLIANVVAKGADMLFDLDFASLGSAQCWLAAILYTLQIYYDFSGYSDMAIGLGGMFGFTIPENFDTPYLSGSVTEFWRRWHISLGSWFREYVYIPLGGNRKGLVRTCVNLAAVFLLTGVWHGAGFTYIAWGAMYALLIVLERLWLGKVLKKHQILSHVYLLLVVVFGWVIFRSISVPRAAAFILRMIMPWRYVTDAVTYVPNLKTIIVIVIGILAAGPVQRIVPQKLRERWRGSVAESLCCVALLVLCMAALAADTYNPFIYFQF